VGVFSRPPAQVQVKLLLPSMTLSVPRLLTSGPMAYSGMSPHTPIKRGASRLIISNTIRSQLRKK
jgi:hypothetical protein